MSALVLQALEASQYALTKLLASAATIAQIEAAGQALARCFTNGGRVFSCGNGGSMGDAMHFAEELTGRFRLDRRALPAIAIADPSHISCTANDYGYHEVFSRYLSAHGRAGDILLAISTSGSSKNVILAAQMAKQLGMEIISLSGREVCELNTYAHYVIATPGFTPYADRVQELHIKCIHILIELVEFHLHLSRET